MTTEAEKKEAVVAEIAEKLGETEEQPIEQIRLIVEFAGVEFALKKLAEAVKIQANGGLAVHRGTRKRTFGGVFFYVVKPDLEPNVVKQIFPDFGREIKRILSWDERVAELGDFLQQANISGEIRKNPQVLIEGRPNTVKDIENTIVLTFDHEHKETPYPKGVPAVPENTHMRYLLYVGYRQWQKVEIAVKNPTDHFIAQGYQLWDAELGVMAVFVQQLTTKLLEQARQSVQVQQQLQQQAKKGKKDFAKDSKQDKPPQAKSAKANNKPNKVEKPPKKDANPVKEKAPSSPTKPSAVTHEFEMPEGISPNDAAKLRQLHNAAQTFRERIALMESKGQVGVDMTKRLLTNTEKQIEAIVKQYR